MGHSIPTTQVFIIHIWKEPREIDSPEAQWRGNVEHLSGGVKRYFKNLDEIPTLIKELLESSKDNDVTQVQSGKS